MITLSMASMSSNAAEDNIRDLQTRGYITFRWRSGGIAYLANGIAWSVNLDTKAILSGIPKAGDVANLKELLAQRGIAWY